MKATGVKKKKPAKNRASKFVSKFGVGESFIDIINASVGKTDLIKKKGK